MSRKISLLAIMLACTMLAASCGSDATTTVESAVGDEADQGLPEGPIPVEPDGGIGDGAEPLPGFEDPVDDNTWHGAVVAETNCPGTAWKRVQGSRFSFSVPVDFVDEEAMGIDSEVGFWSNDSGIEAAYDYGWYSGSISQTPGAEVVAVNYSGLTGEQAVVRIGESETDRNMVGILFPEVVTEGGEWNKLGIIVTHDDPADEIIGRCIVGSIEWDF